MKSNDFFRRLNGSVAQVCNVHQSALGGLAAFRAQAPGPRFDVSIQGRIVKWLIEGDRSMICGGSGALTLQNLRRKGLYMTAAAGEITCYASCQLY